MDQIDNFLSRKTGLIPEKSGWEELMEELDEYFIERREKYFNSISLMIKKLDTKEMTDVVSGISDSLTCEVCEPLCEYAVKDFQTKCKTKGVQMNFVQEVDRNQFTISKLK